MRIDHHLMRCGGIDHFFKVPHHVLAVMPLPTVQPFADIPHLDAMHTKTLVILKRISHLLLVITDAGSRFMMTNQLNTFGFGISGNFVDIKAFYWFSEAKRRRTLPPLPFPALIPALN